MKKTLQKKYIALIVLAAVLVITAIWTIWGNTAIQMNQITVSSSRLPQGFGGYRIAHVSDLHNAEFDNLLAIITEAAPDMIAITGDMIDSRRTDIAAALRFAEQAAEIAPCYYVTGNHEARTNSYTKLEASLTDLGIVVLRDSAVTLKRNGDAITLIGLDDPAFALAGDYFDETASMVSDKLSELLKGAQECSILLSHRPELFDIYCAANVNLVLSGHAHGGQIRLPFVGGLVAPDQGLFPEYDAGLYTNKNTHMVVSRGLGNSIFPFRFNNRPEVVLVELQKE